MFANIVEMTTRLIEQLIIGTQHDYVCGNLLEKGDGLGSPDEAVDITRTFETTKDYAAHGSVSELWMVIVIVRHRSWTSQRDNA